MAVFIELTTFDFEKTFKEQVAGNATAKGGGDTPLSGKIRARRPMRGIEVKHDSFACLRVVDASGVHIPIFDSSDPSGMTVPNEGNSNFLLQSVQEMRSEKSQIVETFGDAYVFFFGENPRFIQVNGILLNSNDFRWRTEWWANYNTYLRGTKLAEMGARLYLFYDDIVIEGYVMDSSAQENAGTPWQVMFNFKLFVTDYASVAMPGDTKFPIRNSIQLPEGVSLTEAYAAENLMVKYKGDSFWAESGETTRQMLDASGRLLQAAPDGRPRPYAEWKKVSDALRESTRSVGFSPDVWKAINTLPESERSKVVDMMFRNGTPLRSEISDNIDEYTNNKAKTNKDAPAQKMFSPSTLSAQEADDLFQYAIQTLGQYGVDVNNPSAMNGMGWGAGSPPTYGAQASWSPDQGWQTSTIGPGSNNDALNSVYGPPASTGISSDRSKYYEGSGYYAYGYASAYGGVGYGQAGFGDYGGAGFGAGFGASGDPGYKNPDKFTAAGVAGAQGAYERFIARVNDDTALTQGGVGIGLGVGAGVSVGASVSYNEAPTAFSVTSAEGTLDPSGSVSFGFSI